MGLDLCHFVVCMARQLFSKDRRLWVRIGFPNPHPSKNLTCKACLLRGEEEEDRRQQTPAISLPVTTSQRGCKLSPQYSENDKADGETCKCLRVPGTWILLPSCSWDVGFFLFSCCRQLDSSSGWRILLSVGGNWIPPVPKCGSAIWLPAQQQCPSLLCLLDVYKDHSSLSQR